MLTVLDDLSAVTTVTGVVRSATTGEVFSNNNIEWQRDENGAYIGAILPPHIRPGNQYTLAVSAMDAFDNNSQSTSVLFTMPIEETTPDPMDGGPVLDPSITGETISVSISNGRDIDILVNDLPRGTQIILDYILQEYNEQNPTEQISILPIGDYTITIVDNLGNTQTAYHTIRPYYFSESADINGEGFGGGITDHRLYQEAKKNNYYDMNNTAIRDIMVSIESILNNNIDNHYSSFLKE